MPSGDKIRSTAPVAMAARGMPSYFAVPGSCAIVKPPTALISRSPAAPSDAEPDSTTPTARSARAAPGSGKTSRSGCTACGPADAARGAGGRRRSSCARSAESRAGDSAATRIRSFGLHDRNVRRRARAARQANSRAAARDAAPGHRQARVGVEMFRSLVTASRPPADAPMPTIVQGVAAGALARASFRLAALDTGADRRARVIARGRRFFLAIRSW